MNEEESYYMPMPDNYGGVPQPVHLDKADFVDKIKPEAVVEIIRHKLLGEELIGDKWEKIPALQENAISERGAWELANLMLGAGSINVSISKLNSHQINNRLRNLTKEVLIKILSNWNDYNISSIGQIYYIHSIIFSNALAVLSQAGEGSIQELFKTTVSESRHVSQEKKEPGKLRRVLGLAGGRV